MSGETEGPAQPEGEGQRSLVVAIDGPAASGKGTLARRLAERFGLAHLDTGELYRATALAVLDAAAIRPIRWRRKERRGGSIRGCSSIRGCATRRSRGGLGRRRDPGGAPRLLAMQRSFAAHPPAPARGAVLDGRDIGTVVCPDADVKLFLTASPRPAPRAGSGSCGSRAPPLYTRMSCRI